MNKFRWRIYTELIRGGDDQKVIIDKYFKGYTVYLGAGVWNGKTESNLTIEIIEDDEKRIDILLLAADLRDKFNQTCVLLTEEPVKAVLI